MTSVESFLSGFAAFIKKHDAADLYPYAGYTGFAGALLIKAKDSDLRVAIG